MNQRVRLSISKSIYVPTLTYALGSDWKNEITAATEVSILLITWNVNRLMNCSILAAAAG